MVASAEDETQIITSAVDFWGLNAIAGDRTYPLKCEIDVLYYDSDWNVLWADWGGVGCYLSPGTKPLPLRSGERVELDGFALPGSQQILWERTSIRVIANAPEHKAVEIPDSMERPLDYNLKLAHLDGLVCEQNELDGTHSRIVTVFGNRRLTAQVYVQPDSPIPQFQGAFVRMTGVFSVKEDVSHQTSDLEMWVSDISHIKVLSWLGSDARFDRPASSAEELPAAAHDKLVRIQGVIHTVDSGTSVVIRDPTGKVRVMTRQPNVGSPGEKVEAVGFPALVGLETRLFRGIVRPFVANRKTDLPAGEIAAAPSKLRLTEQVRNLDPAEASRGYPVDVRGVVTWSDPSWHSIFIVDSSGGLEVTLPADGSIALPEFGKDVIIQGVTVAGAFVPEVRAISVKSGMSRTLPSPEPLTFDRAMSGSGYGEWSEIRGYVHSVAGVPEGNAQIILTTPGGEIPVRVRGLAPDPSLASSLIRVAGVCHVSVNDRRQLTGVEFLSGSPDLVKIDEPAPRDLFDTPRRTIGSLLQFNAAREINHRVQVSGVVALHRPGSFLYLEDGEDHLLVLSRQEQSLNPGDKVDVVGIPGNEAGRLVMRDAVYRSVGRGPAPEAVPLVHPETPSLDLDGATVRLDGRLLDRAITESGAQLRLQHGGTIFEALLPDPREAGPTPGSVLQVDGVYRVQFDEYRRPRGFVIALRSPADIRVLSRPPWWTSTRVLWAGSALLAVVIITAGWGISLSRKNRLLRAADGELQLANQELESRVAKRTLDLRLEIAQRQASEDALAAERRLLRTLIDNLPVYLYVKNTDRRFVIGNLPHAQLLGSGPEGDVIGKSDYDLYPRELAERYERDDTRVLADGEALIGHEEPSFINGRPGWFSTTKVPLRDSQGVILGLIGISQDITARKRAEAERSDLQRRLLETSRKAGMAEVATGVLHNVGNVLNSVNVSASLMQKQLRSSEIKTLVRVAELLRDHEVDMSSFLTDDPKGRMLPAIVIELADHLKREHDSLMTEQEHLARNVDHIKGIVAMQQGFAKVSGVLELVDLAELVHHALHIHSTSLDRHKIKVHTEFEEMPPVNVDKHKVMQILVNLITNAKHAIDEARAVDGSLWVKVAKTPGDRVGISVRDNGVGIAAENLTQIFSHGFTTRANGHGFGLHSGALAAREMGGSLTVESSGLGSGATFTLELPFSPQAASN